MGLPLISAPVGVSYIYDSRSVDLKEKEISSSPVFGGYKYAEISLQPHEWLNSRGSRKPGLGGKVHNDQEAFTF
jgi:hypothetical protein